MSRPFENIAFISSATEETEMARKKLAHRFGSVPAEEADVIVALGGDGASRFPTLAGILEVSIEL